MKYLVEDYRVIRFDLRRHGLTGPALDNQYEIESYVSDLSLVIEHLGINSCDLVGHSMGGRIAVKFTMENPNRVRNLVLLAASGAPRGNEGSPPLAMKLMKNSLGRFLIKRMWSRKMAKDTLIDMVHDGSLVTDEEVDRCGNSLDIREVWMQCFENLGWFGTTLFLKKLKKKLQQVLC